MERRRPALGGPPALRRAAGHLGDRAGNFALQNADLALVLGCRLNVRQVGYEFAAFAHHAFRVVVDIDEAELAKPTISPDLAVHADVGFFLDELSGSPGPRPSRPMTAGWRGAGSGGRYPVVLPEYRRARRR